MPMLCGGWTGMDAGGEHVKGCTFIFREEQDDDLVLCSD